MSVFKRAMDYLGLGPDDAYDDYDEYDDDYDDAPARPASRRPAEEPRAPQRPRPTPTFDDPPVRTSPARPIQRSIPSAEYEQPPIRPRAMSLDDSSVQPRPRSGGNGNVVRMNPAPSGSSSETHTVKAVRFEHAQEVADKFKSGQSVIMNLESTDRTEARRLIDFASGLCYGLGGSMEKVATGVYLLKPPASRPADDPYADYR